MERLREVSADEYEVLDMLGSGGMAAVFLAYERRLERRVALKVMSPALMMGHHMVERFHREAVTQANLDHPHIVGVYAVRELQGLHFFAMQFVPGRSLQDALRSERSSGRFLEWPVILTLLYQVGCALEHAHNMGVIHRDVKPGNILLNADARAVVTDFGIAKVLAGPALTMANTVQGTPQYMSPEQCFATEVTPATDQYSLGILAYEMVTGKPPFTGDGFSVMQAQTVEPPPPIFPQRPDCPPALEEAIERMLSKKAGDRFPSVAMALEAMGAHPLSPRMDDPVRLELLRLADVDATIARFGDSLRAAANTPRFTERIRVGRPAPSHPITGAPEARGIPRTPARGSAPLVVARIDLSGAPPVLAAGERVRLRATPRDAMGHEIRGAAVRWSTTTPDVCVVDPSGELVAVRWGRGEIIAETESFSQSMPIIVGTVVLRSVELVDVPPRLRAGSRAPLRARVRDALGEERFIPVRCESSDPRVLTIDEPLTLVARGAGHATITVRLGNQEAKHPVEVTSS